MMESFTWALPSIATGVVGILIGSAGSIVRTVFDHARREDVSKLKEEFNQEIEKLKNTMVQLQLKLYVEFVNKAEFDEFRKDVRYIRSQLDELIAKK